ncbi:MAG: hypothetical protein FWC38_05995 [Proteobacteria bacterium]|nr:hypothetical protein [Pseudomonadota bacterium]MCL2307762.1 hypothetical protein [Pseudomonadota bacterium]
MLSFKKLSIVVAASEKPAIAKTGVGVVGTFVTAHEIQIIVGIATFVFMVMQIITMIPKVRSALRQMAVEREREKRRSDLNFSDIRIGLGDEPPKRETLLGKLRRFFSVRKK